MSSLKGVIWRFAVWLTACSLVGFLLLVTFGEFRFGSGDGYYAEFTNVSNLRKGTTVRIAGVEVGKVNDISINPDATVRVGFS
ncbi:MlaD family protein, partial [Mycolicibacterium elephantis]